MRGPTLAATVVLTLTVATSAACGGAYVDERRLATADRGETNGRSFDFVSNKEDGSEWIFRFRGTSLWVSYSTRKTSEDLGAISLKDSESRKLWSLIDEVNLAGRKASEIDDPEGTVLMRLRDPTDDRHELTEIFFPRSQANDDKDVANLALYLGELVRKYKNEEPNF